VQLNTQGSKKFVLKLQFSALTSCHRRSCCSDNMRRSPLSGHTRSNATQRARHKTGFFQNQRSGSSLVSLNTKITVNMRSASKARLQTSSTRFTQCSKFCEHFKIANPLKRAAITFFGCPLCRTAVANVRAATTTHTAAAYEQQHSSEQATA
jgi:hypothetical protein